MKRISLFLAILCATLIIGFGAGISAAGKAYQFTGTVKSNDGGVLTVERKPAEIWTFATDTTTKGTAKPGDRVTVYYTMLATDVEAKAAPVKKAPAATAKKRVK